MKLWLDDIREMPKDFDIWAKTANEAIAILDLGKITHISFDHDLGDKSVFEGEELTGNDVAFWIEEAAFYKAIPQLTFAVHSANPVGAKNIEATMKQAIKFFEID